MWTLLPALTRHDLDVDSLIQFAWGQEWQWSYHQQPPLLSWIVAGYLEVLGITRFNYILLSQINIAVAFIALWYLAKTLLPPVQALIAVLLLELVPYYSFLSLSLNHTAFLISCWALTTLFLHYSLTKNRVIYWVLLGLCAALSILGKYYSVMMLGAIGFILLFTKIGRNTLKSPGPYVALLMFAGLLFFHVEFVLSQSVGTISHIGDYFSFESFSSRLEALKFFFAQILYLLPLFVVFAWAVNTRTFKSLLEVIREFARVPTSSDGAVICYVVIFFPLLVTTIAGFILGIGPSSRWGGPIWGVTGILLLLQTTVQMDATHYKRLLKFVFGYTILVPLIMLLAATTGAVSNRHAYPGKEFGELVTALWHQEMDRELKIVGGGRLPTYSLAFNALDHPSTIPGLNFAASPWISLSDIDEHGMAVVCIADDDKCIDDAKAMFPALAFSTLTVRGKRYIFSRYRTESLKYFFVPPQHSYLFVPPQTS
jgi:4-amino-4-deoxy-L-arabinose transferase-like glycosyltransferase